MSHGRNSMESDENFSVEVCTPTREWTFERLSNANDRSMVIDKINLEIKTRTDALTSIIPETLYSSLKYQFMHTVQVKLDPKDKETQEMLCCNIKIIDPSNGREVLKNNQPMLVGKNSGIALIRINSANEKADQMTLYCKVKLQFSDCSYHFKKMHFAIRCEYFLPRDMSQFLAVTTSAPFQVYARRTNNKRSNNKRKLDLDEDFNGVDDEISEPAQKKRNTKNNRASLEDYRRTFEDLVAFRARMNQEEQRFALQFAIQRLILTTNASQLPYGNILQLNNSAHIDSYFSDLLTPSSTMPSLLEPSSMNTICTNSSMESGIPSLLLSGNVSDPFAYAIPIQEDPLVDSPTDSESSMFSDNSDTIDLTSIFQASEVGMEPSYVTPVYGFVK
jgi:hypothetical protein